MNKIADIQIIVMFIVYLCNTRKTKNKGIKIEAVNARDIMSFSISRVRNNVTKIPSTVKAMLKIHKLLACLCLARSPINIPIPILRTNTM